VKSKFVFAASAARLHGQAPAPARRLPAIRVRSAGKFPVSESTPAKNPGKPVSPSVKIFLSADLVIGKKFPASHFHRRREIFVQGKPIPLRREIFRQGKV